MFTFASMLSLHQIYIKRCIQLALNGLGSTSPNPLVGSVIVFNGSIIGEGWHYKSGLPHAEVNAINSVQNHDLLQESTLYVNLEPCAHFGKTPPCASLIVEKKIPRVVIGSLDPNPQVAGKGIKILKDAGIEVVHGICSEECNHLNRVFFHYHKNNLPYIVLKWAQTSDGFMDILRHNQEKGSIAISSAESRTFAHQLRSQCDAILIGSGTALTDEPELTTRLVAGKNPQKIIVDRSGRIPLNHKSANNSWIFSTKGKSEAYQNTNRIIIAEENFIHEMLKYLSQLGIQSVLVEGGRTVLQHFIDENIWQEIYQIIAPIQWSEGLKAPLFTSTPNEEFNIQNDFVKHFINA